MKKLIPVILCLALFAGCKKDDQASTSLVGKWILKRTSYRSGSDLRPNRDSTYNSNENYFQFNSNGTGTSNIRESYNDESGYRINNVSGTFTYKFSDGNLFLQYPAVYMPLVRTVSFSDGQLILHHEENYTPPANFGQVVMVTQKTDEYYSR